MSDSTLKSSRKEFSKHTPKIETLQVDKKDIATVIGKGGATIREIVETSGAKVDVKDTGEVTVDKKDIAAVIGKGGATIREIVEKSGAKVDVNDEGVVTVAAPDEDSRNIAMQMIKDITAKAELNKIYSGKVMKIMEFGAFVNFLGCLLYTSPSPRDA